VCHQSVGLIARAIEETGIPTLSLTSAWSITESAGAPRAAYTDFPLGHTAGRPDQPDEQVAVIRDALDCFTTIDTPGMIVPLDYRWHDPSWRADARCLVDRRSKRHATPQYQSDDDRRAAIERFGESVACQACVPGQVPGG
jgi:hypothetical protein